LRRGVVEVLRRGAMSAIANWQLTVIRFGEMAAFGAIAVLTAIAMVLPLLVTIGITLDRVSPEDLAGAVVRLLERWVILFWVVVAFTVLLLLFLAVHAFVEAGRARVLASADRAAGMDPGNDRSRFAVFTLREWFAGGSAGWWPLFWIYNAIWGLAGLILLLPLLPTLLLMLVMREQPRALIVTGCLGLLFTLLLGIVVGFVAGVWTTRAVAEWGLGRRTARQAMSAAWRALREDFARHFLAALAMIAIGMAGSAFFTSLGFFVSFGELFGDDGMIALFTLPLRFASSILSWFFSAAISTWYLGSYVALAVERESAGAR
jgi:hypothetical protein